MQREFVSTATFDRLWVAMGLGDDERRELELLLLKDAQAGVAIPGAGGARKLRIEYAGHGKRGGARVIYVDIAVFERVFFLLAYPKGVKEDIRPAEKKAIAAIISELKDELAKSRRR